MSNRQETRAFGDLRHMERDKRLRKLLAAKAKPQTQPATDPNALVIGVGPGLCLVSDGGETRQVRCELAAAPGDRVFVAHEKVQAIGPRHTTLSRTDPGNAHRIRVIAANLDIAVIVASIADPPFRSGLVDRYMVAASVGGVRPVLCLNKCDLDATVPDAGAFGIPTVRCSTRTGRGIDELRDLLAGSLCVFVGHSGVGKSSLLNALAGEEEIARTGVVAEHGRGRHTTTSSRLYELPNGARVIDTPGIREFGLGRLSAAEVQAGFPEFAGLPCRFRDCAHRDEPGCAVRERGGARYASYLRLLDETGGMT